MPAFTQRILLLITIPARAPFLSPTPFHSSTVTTRVFRKLNKSEISTFNDALKEMSDWCQLFTPLIKNTPLATVQKYTSMVIRELSAQYHNTKAPRIKPDSRAVKVIRQALNDVPPPNAPAVFGPNGTIEGCNPPMG